MKEPLKKKKPGRPATGKNATKPNITIPNSIQDEAQEIAAKIGMGYSEFVTIAIVREIKRQEVMLESRPQSLQSMPDAPEESHPRKKAAR